jgi:cytochrome bd-type quinol oxidase subunit 1
VYSDESQPTSRRKISALSSGLKNMWSLKTAWICYLYRLDDLVSMVYGLEFYLSMAVKSFCLTLAAFPVSWSFYTVGRTPWTGYQPVARPLPAYRTTQTQNKCTQTSMPQVGFEPMIPVF